MPVKVQISLNTKDLAEWADRIKHEAPEVFHSLLEEAGEHVAGIMRDKAPVRTGFLRSSITTHVGRDSVEVAPTAFYVPFVEYGTRPHIIEPVRASVLAFEVGGEAVFAKRVQHPGFTGAFFVRDAKAEALPRIRELFRDYAELLFGEVG